MTFIKKYWKTIIIGILVVALSFAIRSCSEYEVKAIANEMANNEMAKQAKKKDLLLNGYRAANTRLYAEKAETDAKLKNTGENAENWASISEKQRKKILELSDYKERAEQLNLQLMGANDFILTMNDEYIKNIDELNKDWFAIVKSKDNEIRDLNALWDELNLKYGDLVKKYVIVKLRGKQRLNIGFFAGYSIDGRASAGIGLTFDLIRLPFKIF